MDKVYLAYDLTRHELFRAFSDYDDAYDHIVREQEKDEDAEFFIVELDVE